MDQQPCLDTQHVTDGSLSLCLTGIVFNSSGTQFSNRRVHCRQHVRGLGAVRGGVVARKGVPQGAGPRMATRRVQLYRVTVTLSPRYRLVPYAATTTASPRCCSSQRVGSSVFADTVYLANTGAAALASRSTRLAAELRHYGQLAGDLDVKALSVSDFMYARDALKTRRSGNGQCRGRYRPGCGHRGHPCGALRQFAGDRPVPDRPRRGECRCDST